MISSRESRADLDACLAALRAACGAQPVVLDLLVNGNPAPADEMATALGPTGTGSFQVRVWRVEFGDETHAWN